MSHALAQTLPSPAADLGGYLRAVKQFPMLTADRERQLAEDFRATDNLDAAWQLVTSHLRYVVKLARGFRGYGLPEEDLIQEGNVGLMKAVKRFDPAVGVRLGAFAVHWIRAEIHEFVLRNWSIVKVATTKAQRKLFFKLRSSKKALGQLSVEEAHRIADDLDVKVSEVMEMDVRLSRTDAVIHPVEGDRSFAPINWIAQPSSDPETEVGNAEYLAMAQSDLRRGMAKLDDRSREIISRRWLQEPKTPLRELAKKYGLSIERIRQIEANAMLTLREAVVLHAGALHD